MNGIEINLKNGRLLINDRPIALNAEVLKAILVDRFVAIEIDALIDEDPHRTPPRNVFLLNSLGQVVWQIEEFKEVKGRTGYYSNIWLSESGELMAGNVMGFDCVIDIETGKIKSYEFTK